MLHLYRHLTLDVVEQFFAKRTVGPVLLDIKIKCYKLHSFVSPQTVAEPQPNSEQCILEMAVSGNSVGHVQDLSMHVHVSQVTFEAPVYVLTTNTGPFPPLRPLALSDVKTSITSFFNINFFIKGLVYLFSIYNGENSH